MSTEPIHTIYVRQATAGDIAAVQRVAALSWHQCYQSMLSKKAIDGFLARAYGEYSLRQTLGGGGLLVLERVNGIIANELIGYLRLHVRDDSGYLAAIYLLPDEQGKGYGRTLWEAALEWFKSRGVSEVMLTVAAGNERARAFYQRLGFMEMAETTAEIGGEALNEISCRYQLG